MRQGDIKVTHCNLRTIKNNSLSETTQQDALRFLQLRYLTNPSTNFNRNQQIQIAAGIVPCISGPLVFTVTNKGKNRLELPKQAVIAEIYPISSDFIDEFEVGEDSIKGKDPALRRSTEIQTNKPNQEQSQTRMNKPIQNRSHQLSKRKRRKRQFYHSNITCGQHFGREKTLAPIKRYFYWFCMSDSVTEIINS